MNIQTLILMILAYLYGSIPFALVIGKLFYHTDVREYGSGNLGGSNTGRVLGKKAGLIVIILDISKCMISVLVTMLLSNIVELPDYAIYLVALSCIIGHCFPIFASFKGGKAVSVFFGYLLATSFYMFAIVGICFLSVLKITKYVSLASICCALVMLLITPLPIFNYGMVGLVTNAIIVALLIYRHKANIIRLKNKTENKITWM
ncbi:MAG: glycerol-3-phosphate 1-O-acyltransferase PlsY [Erysipelotrichaceae bacterium]|nr:glycerol-3-phosphate 1-O-acyltransferase PlsY [Erysipelotrichaceae bacterium]